MTASDRTLMALGAFPPVMYAGVIVAGTAAGVTWPGGAAAVLGVGVFLAAAFPGLANFLRMRRDRQG